MATYSSSRAVAFLMCHGYIQRNLCFGDRSGQLQSDACTKSFHFYGKGWVRVVLESAYAWLCSFLAYGYIALMKYAFFRHRWPGEGMIWPDDGYADSDMWDVVAVANVRVVIRGPSSCSDPIPVGEGYRVGKKVGLWAESMNNGVEAYEDGKKASSGREKTPLWDYGLLGLLSKSLDKSRSTKRPITTSMMGNTNCCNTDTRTPMSISPMMIRGNARGARRKSTRSQSSPFPPRCMGGGCKCWR